jgi:hypothetical protein
MQLWKLWHATIQDCKRDDADKMDAAMQLKYRSGVGMLLYLIKYLRSDLANVLRKLSKHGWCRSSSLQGDAESLFWIPRCTA